MSDQIFSSVSGTHGPVNTGPGGQNNTFLFAPLADFKGKAFRRDAADVLLRLRRCFVEPPGFGRAREMLRSRGTVFLDGVPGSGRRAAAQMLLYELRVGKETFREMPLNNENDEGKPLLALDGIVDGDLLLLDLSEVEEKLWTRAHRELHSVHAEVHQHQAGLVVVLPNNRAERLAPVLGEFRAEIGRPSEQEVLQRYLRQDGFSPDVTRQPSSAVDEFLGGRPPMEEIAHFIEFVVEARNKAKEPADFAAWCKEAYAALSDREGQAAEESTTLCGRQRALFLATAMLHGAHADSVQQAGASLLREVKHPQDDLPLLDQADLLQRFREIGAERDAEGRVRFWALGYDAAVRNHFWTHMPELRDDLRTWVGRTAVSVSFDRDARDELVRRFADLCLHDRYRGMLLAQARRWSAGSVNGAGPRAAVQALTKGVEDPRHGSFFRRQIREWSMEQTMPDALAQVIIAICVEVMAVRHPYEATVRLHHLARRERETTRARDALTQLVGGDRRLLRLMYERLHRELTGLRRYAADLDLFLDLADPEPLTGTGNRAWALIAQDAVRDQLIAGWSVIFEQRADDAWRPAARRWLLAAIEGGPRDDVLLDVLVEGGRERNAVLSRLYVMAGELERFLPIPQGHEARLRDRVLHKINMVRGVQVA